MTIRCRSSVVCCRRLALTPRPSLLLQQTRESEGVPHLPICRSWVVGRGSLVVGIRYLAYGRHHLSSILQLRRQQQAVPNRVAIGDGGEIKALQHSSGRG